MHFFEITSTNIFGYPFKMKSPLIKKLSFSDGLRQERILLACILLLYFLYQFNDNKTKRFFFVSSDNRINIYCY